MSGIYEGDKCERNNCQGVIETHPSDNCSCHLCAPCSSCTTPRNFCPKCGWEECDDVTFNGYICNIDKKTGNYRFWEPQPLDRTKLDYRIEHHTYSSMKLKGCFPKGMPWKDIEEKVRGTFGGRLTKWDEENCEFEYIAYTD